jgi:hypothetical protein
LGAAETFQFDERSAYQLGEEEAFVDARRNQQSSVPNQLVLHVRRLTALSMKCACHPQVFFKEIYYTDSK